MFSLICTWINDWVNNREAGDLKHHWALYSIIVMEQFVCCVAHQPNNAHWVQCPCCTVYLLENPDNAHSIAYLWGWDGTGLLWVSSLIYVLVFSLHYPMQYCEKFDHIVTAFNCNCKDFEVTIKTYCLYRVFVHHPVRSRLQLLWPLAKAIKWAITQLYPVKGLLNLCVLNFSEGT